MFEPSHIELNKTAFKQNVQFLREYIGEDVTFCSVIKGNAYGHGINCFVPMAEECGIRHFGVFSADEARRAFNVKREEDSHIMIMGMVEGEALPWAIRNGVSFFVFEPNRLHEAARLAEQLNTKARVHLHLETGMNRLGLDPDTLDQVATLIDNHRNRIMLEGLCTHYAGAESVGNYVRITRQIENFKKYCAFFESRGIKPRYRHTACSAAALNYPDTTMDMVRFGIAQYGFWPNRETYMNFVKTHRATDRKHIDPLNPVITWKSVVMSTKEVDAGEFVGYGNVYLTNREQIIASIPIGYAHGFARSLTNSGMVLINGRRAPVVGLVNMNLITVDVTEIPDVKKGNEVVLIGKQGEKEITVASFSEISNHFNYEVLVRIPSELPRRVV